MPRATRNKVANAVPVEEPAEEMEVDDDQEEEGGQALKFDEPLNWRAGKAIPVAELLRRLKLLAAELKELQQEDVDTKSIVPKAQELASSQLLAHKDAGVRSYALLCIVEVFRLTAPNAPYKMNQLKEIFTLIISFILPALADAHDPYSQQHQEILHSLSDVKSIILVSELPGSDSLVLNLFTNCFDVMSGNTKGSGRDPLSKSVEFNMTGMLIAYLDEAQTLPSGVIDILLAQFLRADPTLSAGGKKSDSNASSSVHEVSPAYNMARSVCNSVTEKMARHVGQYFNAVLIDASQSMGVAKMGKPKSKKRTYEDSDDDDSGLLTPPSEEDLQEVQKAHRLLRELWRSCPDIIRNVVPQIEAEIATENLPLRVMAVETLGDMIAGIGAAGPPPPPVLDPAAYPSHSIDPYRGLAPQNVLLIPAAPLAFSSAYPSAYQSFFDRYRDKAPLVRAAWVTGVGRVIVTSGGGKGLDSEQEPKLIRCLADMLMDTDEKVRLAAINAVARFDYPAVLQKLGSLGGVTTPSSVLCNLADRIKDTKPNVRTAAIELLGRIWGVAAGAIAENGERVRAMLGAIPSRIFEAMYVNDKSLNALVVRVMFDSLLPTNFPPIKSRAGESQRIPDSQNPGEKAPDRDRIRAERILVLVRDLEDKAKTVFFSLQHAQASKARYFEIMLESAEKLNGDDDDKEAQVEAKKKMEALVNIISASFPDAFVASTHLNKFFKSADRRNFALSRFCISPESEYHKVNNAMKELLKRLEDSPGSIAGVHETVKAFVRSAAILVYNRSHVPTIMEFSRSDENGLGSAAHEVLKEISAKAPKVFKVHIKELCESLKKQAPSASTPNEATAVESLKACAGFARHFPDDMGQGRDFYKAMVKYAQFGTPPAVAKHAVSVIVASAEKKEMYIGDILKFCLKDFKSGAEGFLARLAALSQLRLLANEEIEDDDEAITEIMTSVLADNGIVPKPTDPDWTDTPDDDLTAKLWALKAISNKVRGYVSVHDSEEPTDDLRALSEPVFRLLNTLIEREGALSSVEESTPKHHRSQLRLAAAKHLLKLCCSKALDKMFTPRDFNRLTRIVQDALPEVRAGFNAALKKYNGQNLLPRRFYSFMFLYAFEPKKSTKEATITFVKARATNFAKSGDQLLEGVFSQFLSLLAHHQDFSTAPDDLRDFVDYIIFYLKIVATEANLPVIYSIAQRMKTVQDGIDPERSENLYVLSDLAEAIIRIFQEQRGWSLQIFAGKTHLPQGIFARMPSHAAALEIAEKRFVPEELADELEDLVKERMKTKKRKAERADAATDRAAKKVRASTAKPVRKVSKAPKAAKPAKTPKKRLADVIPSSDRRKSARTSNARNYAEADSDEEDDEDEVEAVDDEDASDVEVDGEVGREEGDQDEELTSTPPTSDPMPAAATAAASRRGKQLTEKKMTEKNATGKKATKKKQQPPARAGRATRTRSKNADVFDMPGDSDEELSDVPDEMEA